MTNHHATAASYSAQAGGQTRRAKRDAELAAEFYGHAAATTTQAAQLTRRPEFWTGYYNPAELEARAASWTRAADTMLRASFHATAAAQLYRDLAARYREMAGQADARMAAR